MSIQSSVNQLLASATAGAYIANNRVQQNLNNVKAQTDLAAEAADGDKTALNVDRTLRPNSTSIIGGMKATKAEQGFKSGYDNNMQKQNAELEKERNIMQAHIHGAPINELRAAGVNMGQMKADYKAFANFIHRGSVMSDLQQRGGDKIQQNQDFKAFVEDLRNKKQISHSTYAQMNNALKGDKK